MDVNKVDKKMYLGGMERMLLSKMTEDMRADIEKLLKNYDMEACKVIVARPTSCVILCSNCVKICPVGAISFPPTKHFVDLLNYE